MHPLRWIPATARAVLDVGCNAGDLLADLDRMMPGLQLAGVDVNPASIALARERLPHVDLRVTSGHALPYPDAAFDVVTCIEVLEHVPAAVRPAVVAEIGRVLAPGGLLVLRVPHAGATQWLDSNNVRFRWPTLYARTVGGGRRDDGYASGSGAVVWHHHFTRDEIVGLCGPGWSVTRVERGGLVLYPLADILRWPFYRVRRTDHPLFRLLQQIAEFDLGVDYGVASFDMLLLLLRE